MKQNWIALLLGAAALATATTAMAGPGLPIRFAGDRAPEKYVCLAPESGPAAEHHAWQPARRVMLVRKLGIAEERRTPRPLATTGHHRRLEAPPVGERHGLACAHCGKGGPRQHHHRGPQAAKAVLEPVAERTSAPMRFSKEFGRWGLHRAW